MVTITGLHLQSVSMVEFISGSAIGIGRHVVDVNAKEVRGTSPTGSPDDNPYDITVTNPHGTSATNTGDEFTYTADPSPGKIFVHTSNLSFDDADNLNITGAILTGESVEDNDFNGAQLQNAGGRCRARTDGPLVASHMALIAPITSDHAGPRELNGHNYLLARAMSGTAGWSDLSRRGSAIDELPTT